jgi:16S rRNA (adenine1518-N6/adenine1519-N6)-dimethyltransferase
MSNLPATNKSLGQHWLTDDASLQAMCVAADVRADDTILEIGPGPGALTQLLVQQAREVVAVEFDEGLATTLPRSVPAPNLRVVQQDILRFDLTTLPSGYKVAANIPYYLTSKLLRSLCESPNPPATIALLIQKEVAQRVAAAPGDMSLLSVSVQLYYEAELREMIPARLFTPPPKVDSQILKLTMRNQPLFPGLDYKAFFRVVKAGFAARRKTLLNSLAGGLRQGKPLIEQALQHANLQPNMRPQELSLQQWHALYQAFPDFSTEDSHKA